jgi:integrase
MAQLHSGTFRSIQQITFGDFAQKWLKDYSSSRVKPTTYRSYRGMVKWHLAAIFGSQRLTDITPDQVQAYMAKSLREKPNAPATINKTLVLLKQILKHAKQWGYLRENPAEDIKHARVESVEMDYLNPDEVRLLLKHADEPYRTLFLTAVLTGMRMGELLALQWGDMDWNANRIHVRRSVFWYLKREAEELGQDGADLWRFTSPKSKRSKRAIIMSPGLKEALELHRLQCPASPHDLVFCTPRGTTLQYRNLIRREFEPALTRAGLRKIRFHDLRHTYTSLLIAQGAHAKFIQSQLGHASIQTTLDRYGHLLPEAQVGTGERLDAQLFGAKPQVSSVAS